MKKVFGYVLGLVAALTFAGAIATTANADGGSADAASGNSTELNAPVEVPGISSSSSSLSSSSSSAASSSSVKPENSQKPLKKPAKNLAKAKRVKARKSYRKNARALYLKNARKGATIKVVTAKGKLVKSIKVKKNGKLTIKLSKKEAKKLAKGGKRFSLKVSEKGYKGYSLSIKIAK